MLTCHHGSDSIYHAETTIWYNNRTVSSPQSNPYGSRRHNLHHRKPNTYTSLDDYPLQQRYRMNPRGYSRLLKRWTALRTFRLANSADICWRFKPASLSLSLFPSRSSSSLSVWHYVTSRRAPTLVLVHFPSWSTYLLDVCASRSVDWCRFPWPSSLRFVASA